MQNDCEINAGMNAELLWNKCRNECGNKYRNWCEINAGTNTELLRNKYRNQWGNKCRNQCARYYIRDLFPVMNTVSRQPYPCKRFIPCQATRRSKKKRTCTVLKTKSIPHFWVVVGGGWWKIKSAVYLWAFSTKSDGPWRKFLKRKFKKKI